MLKAEQKTYKKTKNEKQLFEEQLKLYFSKDCKSKSQKNSLDENLGQVFTSPPLAKFMFSLFSETISSQNSILDPCIGPNSFFKALPDRLANCSLKGIEIDNRLITKKTNIFFSSSKRSLVRGSFFDLNITDKFDLIIQNPPYVRQELLSEGINSKKTIKNKLSSKIPSQSNLYVYFLLKAILHLKENGVMVAVIYDSWLYSSFGAFLKEAFVKLGHLDSIYHFKKSAFENIEVGATVIKFIKSNNTNLKISYYPLTDLSDINIQNKISIKPQIIKQNKLTSYSFNNDSIIDFKSLFFNTINSITSKPIQRGTSAIINNYFLFSKKTHPELKPIIKDVSRIKTYGVLEGNAFILDLNSSITSSTKEYLESIKNNVLDTPSEKYKAVKRNIASNKNWYTIKIKSSGNFIFNYYLRNNIDFIYNPNKHLSSDNFYSVNIEHSELAYLAILNSSLTRLNVLNNSRSQGNGLRKIQLYEFKEVKVVDIKNISSKSINDLEELGKSLMIVNRYDNQQNEIIEKIDFILLNEYNKHNNSSIRIEELKNELKEYIK